VEWWGKISGLTEVTTDTTDRNWQPVPIGSVDYRWPAIVVMLSNGAVVYRTLTCYVC